MAGQVVLKTVSQDIISETVQPIYIGGIDPLGSDSKLTITSNGNVSTATPLTVPSLTVNSKPVMSSLLAEYTVTGSPVTSIDFSGLDINTHKSYRVEVEAIRALSSGNAWFQLFINNDTNPANYYVQELYANGTGIVPNRENHAGILYQDGATSNAVVFIQRNSNGRISIISNGSRNDGASIGSMTCFVTKTATVSNITQITLVTAQANDIGIGTKVRIFRGDV